MRDAPFHPIIYVGGYPLSEAEQNEALADPYGGFKSGSVVQRASASRNQPSRKFVFDSPIQRLVSDYGYSEVLAGGRSITDPDWMSDFSGGGIPSRSIIIHRYFRRDGQPSIEDYSRSLSELIARVRDLVLAGDDGSDPEGFRCYLVAYSEGGLVARGMLQNPKLDIQNVSKTVAKLFTFATPHNGLDEARDLPRWTALSLNEISELRRERIASLTDMQAINRKYGRVDFMPASAMPIENVFCMVGTSPGYYELGAGLSRQFLGRGSDGVVKIENASLWGLDRNGNVTHPAATAFAHRSHAGFFGLVNSEEAYDNLVRFLFGDLRADVWLNIQLLALPEALNDKNVDALYLFELQARTRGKRSLLSRRLAEENSAACRTHAELADPQQPGARLVYLSTLFFSNRSKVNPRRRSLACALDVGVRMPEYEVQRKPWMNEHFEGAYLFRDTVTVELVPPASPKEDWQVRYGWQSQDGMHASRPISHRMLSQGSIEVRIPFGTVAKPSMAGEVLLSLSSWNLD